jgi:hypothetical protein
MKNNSKWYPNPKHQKYFRLADGNLLTAPMREDGSMDDSEILQVDFDATQFEPPVDAKYVTLSEELGAVKRELEKRD